MIAVTSGKKYIDIDAYAGCVAYRDLLRLLGKEAVAITTAPLNESITESLRKLPVGMDDYETRDEDEFVIVDLSNPEFLDEMVEQDRVMEVIDHHPGFENYWQGRGVKKVQIEPIGAVATLIVERYEEAGLLEKMEPEAAKLLLAAILDNTLNFQAKITNSRDKEVYEKLLKIAGEDDEFAERYFRECQEGIEKDPGQAIRNDLKMEKTDSILPAAIGQVILWDRGDVLGKVGEIRGIMEDLNDGWIVNMVALKEGRSYILTSGEKVQMGILGLYGGEVEDDMVRLDNVWLRKEIIKKALENYRSSAL